MSKKTLIIWMALLFMAEQAFAARIVMCGFELNTTTDGVEWTDSDTGTLSIDTTITKNSAYALKAASASSGPQINITMFATAPNRDLYYSFDYYEDSWSFTSSHPFFSGNYSGSTQLWALEKNTDGVIELTNRAGSVAATGATVITQDVWHHIEVREDYVASPTYTNVTVKLDGVEEIAATVVGDSTGNSSVGLSAGQITGNLGQTSVIYFDNIRVNDDTGSNQNSWCGEGYLRYAFPNATGDSGQWASSSGGQNYTDVDEFPPDTADYVKRISGAPNDYYNMQDSGTAGLANSDQINLVAVGTYNGATGAATGTKTAITRVKSQASGTAASSAQQDWSINGWGANYDDAAASPSAVGSRPGLYNLISYVDPQAGGSWTPALITTMQAGVSADQSSAQEIRCAALWVVIDFTPKKFLTLLGVGN